MYLMLLLIEMVDIIRVLIFVMMKNVLWKKGIYWLVNVLIPPLNGKRLISILMKRSWKKLCRLLESDESIVSKMGSLKEINENDLFKHCLIIFIENCFIFVILCLIDLKYFGRKEMLKDEEEEFDESEIDEDVIDERRRVLSNEIWMVDPFVVMDIVKKYPNKDVLAINHLTFSIEHGQCFGLLGFNGAGKSSSSSCSLLKMELKGKTSLYKIIVGEEKWSRGCVYIGGKKYENVFDGICREIGYCPQYDCIETKLSVEENLYLFGRLKGINHFQLEQTIESLSRLFLLELFLKQYPEELSGGTRRRVHAALACMGHPSLILLGLFKSVVLIE